MVLIWMMWVAVHYCIIEYILLDSHEQVETLSEIFEYEPAIISV